MAPFVVKLPKQPGCKEHRYAHLLCGTIDLPATPAVVNADEIGSAPVLPTSLERIAALENTVTRLSEELTELKQAFEEFKKSFE